MNQNHRRRVSAREGKVIVEGYTVMDTVKFKVTSAPEVAKARGLGEKTQTARYMGVEHKITITEYKSTNIFRDVMNKFLETGETPEFTIQGIANDKHSDYYDTYGIDTVTCTGCVITSEIPIMELDSEGEFIQNEVEFLAYSVT